MESSMDHTRIECLVGTRDKWKGTRSEERLTGISEIIGQGHTRIECLAGRRDKWKRTRSEERLTGISEIMGQGHTREESLIEMNE